MASSDNTSSIDADQFFISFRVSHEQLTLPRLIGPGRAGEVSRSLKNVSVSQFVALRTAGPPRLGYRIKVPVVRPFTVTNQPSRADRVAQTESRRPSLPDGRSTRRDRRNLAKHVQTLKRNAPRLSGPGEALRQLGNKTHILGSDTRGDH